MPGSGHHFLDPVPSTSTISRSYSGRPIVGPLIDTTALPRVLIGWTHQDDSPEGLMRGQLFCSVSRNGRSKLQIFDTSGNRSKQPGVVVFCGVANYTMIRMFHPYWAEAGPNGTIPRDMAWRPNHQDKARLRQLYHEFLRDHYGVGDDGEPIFPVPVLEGPADLNADDNSLFFPHADQGNANTSKPTSGDKPGRVTKGKVPKAAKGPKKPRATRTNKTRPSQICNDNHSNHSNANAASSLSLSTNILRRSEVRRLAAQDDGQSLKSESRSSSVTHQPISLNTTPVSAHYSQPVARSTGRHSTNPIDLINLTELQAAVEEQARANPASSSPSNTLQHPIDVDDYTEGGLDDERLLAEWQVGAPTSSSPQLSNGRVQESIEVDQAAEHDAQVPARDGEDTVVVVDDGDDMVMIYQEGEDVKIAIDVGVVVQGRRDGLTEEDPIVLE